MDQEKQRPFPIKTKIAATWIKVIGTLCVILSITGIISYLLGYLFGMGKGTIFFALIAIIGIFGVLSLRSYVILPKRRRRETELINKVQVFKDVWNIRAVILIHKQSGLPIYSEEISIMGKTI